MTPLTASPSSSLEQAVAAPFATRQLADLGARVIKIERPDGGDFARGYDTTVKGLSSYFVWLNRSKESLTLDLKQPGGADDPRRGCSRAPTCSCRTSRPARPIGSARRRPSSARALSAAHRLHGVGLRLVRARTPTRRRTTCWCRARSGCCRSPAPKTRRRRSASRSPTSPPACTRTPAS